MRTAYRVQDLPTQGAGAFCPTQGVVPLASSWGLVHLVGSPGTAAIPVDSPTEVWAPTPGGRGSGLGHLQGSNNSPNVIRPDKYIPSAANMGPQADADLNLRIIHRNPIPVPAVGATRIPRNAMSTPKVGGRSAPSWPRAFQRWPSLTGRGSG